VLVEFVLRAQSQVLVTLGAIDESDVKALLSAPWSMMCSDGMYHHSAHSGAFPPHSRSTGKFPRILGHYARDECLFTLAEAIRKMTSFPARWRRLRHRGEIRAGSAADRVVFDPGTIDARSAWSDPLALTAGVVHVVVNGKIAVRNGNLTGVWAGAILQRDAA